MFSTESDRLDDQIRGELDDYQAISPLAVASLLVGAASATALLAIPLWIVPLAGILVSWLALLRIRRSAGTLTGRALALVGLSLAVCFGSAALAAHFGSQRILARQAEAIGAAWFEALARHEPELAHQWTVELTKRAGVFDPVELRRYYEENPKQTDALDKFEKGEPVPLLLALGPRAHAELKSTTFPDDQREFVTQVYQVSYDDGQPQQFEMVVNFQRLALPGRHHPWWRVFSWTLPGPVPPLPKE